MIGDVNAKAERDTQLQESHVKIGLRHHWWEWSETGELWTIYDLISEVTLLTFIHRWSGTPNKRDENQIHHFVIGDTYWQSFMDVRIKRGADVSSFIVWLWQHREWSWGKQGARDPRGSGLTWRNCKTSRSVVHLFYIWRRIFKPWQIWRTTCSLIRKMSTSSRSKGKQRISRPVKPAWLQDKGRRRNRPQQKLDKPLTPRETWKNRALRPSPRGWKKGASSSTKRQTERWINWQEQ